MPRTKQSFIVAGSKDCRITVWEIDASGSKSVLDKSRNPAQILYGHHNEITGLCIEKTLGIIVSCDKVYY